MKLTQPLNYTETVYEGWGVLGVAYDGETRFSCVSLLAVRWLLLAPAAPKATTVLSTLHRSSNTDTEKRREGKAQAAEEGKIYPMIGKSAHAAGGGEQASFYAQPLCKLLGSWVGNKMCILQVGNKMLI